jgi:hypothetical protein
MVAALLSRLELLLLLPALPIAGVIGSAAT